MILILGVYACGSFDGVALLQFHISVESADVMRSIFGKEKEIKPPHWPVIVKKGLVCLEFLPNINLDDCAIFNWLLVLGLGKW